MITPRLSKLLMVQKSLMIIWIICIHSIRVQIQRICVHYVGAFWLIGSKSVMFLIMKIPYLLQDNFLIMRILLIFPWNLDMHLLLNKESGLIIRLDQYLIRNFRSHYKEIHSLMVSLLCLIKIKHCLSLLVILIQQCFQNKQAQSLQLMKKVL